MYLYHDAYSWPVTHLWLTQNTFTTCPMWAGDWGGWRVRGSGGGGWCSWGQAKAADHDQGTLSSNNGTPRIGSPQLNHSYQRGWDINNFHKSPYWHQSAETEILFCDALSIMCLCCQGNMGSICLCLTLVFNVGSAAHWSGALERQRRPRGGPLGTLLTNQDWRVQRCRGMHGYILPQGLVAVLSN